MYFDQLSGAPRTRKLVKILFWLFLIFFVHFKRFFGDFSFEIKNTLEKQCFKLLFKVGRHLNAKWVPQICHFWLIFIDYSWKIREKRYNEQKRLKTAKKSILTSSWVCKAPKSWSTYTTKYDDENGATPQI